MNKNLGVPLALRAAGRGAPPCPPIRRDLGRSLSHKGSAAFGALLTLEGCPKDGVVSPPSASLTLIVSQASQLALYLLTTKNYLKNL